MRRVTKVALVSLALGIISLLIQSGRFEYQFRIFITFALVFLTLSAILALYIIFTSPNRERIPYALSILIGIITGIVLERILFGMGTEEFPLAVTLFNVRHVPALIAVGNVPPLLVLALSFLLLKIFPEAWGETRVRLLSITSSLIAYMVGCYFVFAFWSGAFLVFAPLFVPSMLMGGFYYFFTIELFLYSNTLLIVAGYAATIGIEELRKRSILAFILILLMCSVAGSPLPLGLFS